MLYIAALVFATVFLIFLAGYRFVFSERISLAGRMEQVVGAPEINIRQKELSAPLATRVFKPLLGKAATVFVRVLPSEKEAVLDQKIMKAGLEGKITPVEMMVTKYLGAVSAGLLVLFIATVLHTGLLNTVVFFAAGVPLGLMLPDYYLAMRAKRRNLEVEAQMPQILDLLTVSVEAGLGFDGAVYKVIEKTRGILVQEMKLMMQEINMGKSRREAMKDLGARFDVNDLNSFISAIILGEQLGISIGNVLRTQADQIRIRRRQNAEEQAMKAPVKMLFPLVFLIFPALFIVILGPAAIQIFNTLLQ